MPRPITRPASTSRDRDARTGLRVDEPVNRQRTPARSSLWERFLDHDPKLVFRLVLLGAGLPALIVSQWPRDLADRGAVPVPPGVPRIDSPFDWQRLEAIDFSSNNGGWMDTGIVASRDSSRSRMRQARFGTGPDGKWLTVVAERDSPAAPVYSVDLLGEGHPVPNYFAVNLVYQLPSLSIGMWPAPLWFRPLVTRADRDAQGEIDIMEWFGGQYGLPNEATATIHKTPYGVEHRQLGENLPQLGGDGRNLEHNIRFEKAPGSMTWWIDGQKAVIMNRTAFDVRAGSGAWDDMFENPNRRWYPRITYQVGPGTERDPAGEIPQEWRRSELIVKRLELFKML